jgi:TatD DNase family protein
MKDYPDSFEACIHVSCEPGSMQRVLHILDHPKVYGSCGIHPHDARHYSEDLEARICEVADHRKCLAWGETGLDYHYNHSEPAVQRTIFVRQVKKAVERGKSLIIHSREAEADTMAILQDHVPVDWKIHLHCFTGNGDVALGYIDTFSSLYIGFTGVITFKNTVEIQDAVREVPLDRILLETDAPYMAPMPHRGKPCHTGFVPLIAERIAELKETTLEDVYKRARANTREMYGI